MFLLDHPASARTWPLQQTDDYPSPTVSNTRGPSNPTIASIVKYPFRMIRSHLKPKEVSKYTSQEPIYPSNLVPLPPAWAPTSPNSAQYYASPPYSAPYYTSPPNPALNYPPRANPIPLYPSPTDANWGQPPSSSAPLSPTPAALVHEMLWAQRSPNCDPLQPALSPRPNPQPTSQNTWPSPNLASPPLSPPISGPQAISWKYANQTWQSPNPASPPPVSSSSPRSTSQSYVNQSWPPICPPGSGPQSASWNYANQTWPPPNPASPPLISSSRFSPDSPPPNYVNRTWPLSSIPQRPQAPPQLQRPSSSDLQPEK